MHKISSTTTAHLPSKAVKNQQQDAKAIIEQLRQLLLPQKNPTHKVNEVRAMTPQPGMTWDLKAAAELPTAQEEQSE